MKSRSIRIKNEAKVLWQKNILRKISKEIYKSLKCYYSVKYAKQLNLVLGGVIKNSLITELEELESKSNSNICLEEGKKKACNWK